MTGQSTFHGIGSDQVPRESDAESANSSILIADDLMKIITETAEQNGLRSGTKLRVIEVCWQTCFYARTAIYVNPVSMGSQPPA